MTPAEIIEKRDTLTAKERSRIPQQKMAEQEPHVRCRNIQEVPLGYSPEQARIEAIRCLQCKNKPCVTGCPVQIDIPAFLKLTADNDFKGAIKKLKEKNLLPAICGRVCPQEEQCQKPCTLGKVLKDTNQSVSIGKVERFLADWERESATIEVPAIANETGKKVAVVGSGPAGLTVAGDLRSLGHSVTLFEALHKPGGVLVFGIPEFRLPKVIVQKEVDLLQRMGVKLQTNAVIGKFFTIDELLADGYDAIFVGTGAGLPYFMGIPGENCIGVYSANEYLTRANLMKAYDFPRADTPIMRSKIVVTVGGGNVAMDSARTALRLGAEKSYIVYRRSETEMPARIEEVHHAKEEGVIFNILQNPVKVHGNAKNRMTGVECIKMELGEPDASGRRRPVPIKGSEFVIETDTLIVAIGNGPNPLIPNTTPDIQLTKWGNIVATEGTCKTSKKGVFAGGDIVLGAATVILAMGQGRQAAAAIHEYLNTSVW
ncbi:MAG: glutamate synthase (NADPH), homotetrameric [Candidatus Raymondbacteria bacterium RifOxyA12_full_50_37]|uniref:Glutamate synthase (NADPH), homotetrameric n=1 Tax=Candidatus Raymondbacteria bacterium RIFOXYD12_FULL_49_13 TaxID=1817890 RepID=A0A1F7F410_UNCRA|nr:MAG: glutamate synthase (NADPH), homotetrameric [Candidatus Raymondbacteria bacterium RifOxyA12_full_50_37]OGJ88437.1 MAG: glutamate synthase (NADPH), homotetrameric [Candidatus Raymondbacteria bacterium RIFOXYA2_FULL_49_16]OGJ93105.1 MAG: glutamate synthase (NADPH), homotetrameric [Candidatus Raymondbacteria bacterium RifOxyC12_full_50_8]OGJ98897.1 MAG: glutamate synthase (NADPH), homotetrameric [Candidatus Raymondbacteria bacterium RIFOXYC2_FULL_50_21]OGK01246.1 MAG: glutamate synthase (NA